MSNPSIGARLALRLALNLHRMVSPFCTSYIISSTVTTIHEKVVLSLCFLGDRQPLDPTFLVAAGVRMYPSSAPHGSAGVHAP